MDYKKDDIWTRIEEDALLKHIKQTNKVNLKIATS